MIDIACPHCNALLLGRVCEYCGRDSGIEFLSANTVYELMKDEAFVGLYMYADKQKVYPGEVGKFNGARIILRGKEKKL